MTRADKINFTAVINIPTSWFAVLLFSPSGYSILYLKKPFCIFRGYNDFKSLLTVGIPINHITQPNQGYFDHFVFYLQMHGQAGVASALLVLACASAGALANRKFNINDDLLAFPQVDYLPLVARLPFQC